MRDVKHADSNRDLLFIKNTKKERLGGVLRCGDGFEEVKREENALVAVQAIPQFGVDLINGFMDRKAQAIPEKLRKSGELRAKR